MKSMLRTTSEYARLYAALSFLGILSLAWSACCVVLNPLLPKRHGKALGRWVNTHSFRMYLGFLQNLGVARFDLSELDLLRVGPPLIIAPNHPSLLDAVMIISRVPGVSCIMKSAAVDNAFLGAGARLARYIRNDSVHGMVRRAIEDIQQGHSLLLFPEGTRSSIRPIGRFTRAAAVVARRAEVPIQTVFIETDTAYLSKGSSIFSKPPMPVTYRVRLGRRFEVVSDEQEFIDELERYFVSELERSPLVQSANDDSLLRPIAGSRGHGSGQEALPLTTEDLTRHAQGTGVLVRIASSKSRSGG